MEPPDDQTPPAAWDITRGSPAVKVAVIDSGSTRLTLTGRPVTATPPLVVQLRLRQLLPAGWR